MKKSFAIYFSVILACLSAGGVVYSCRAAAAQRMYCLAKFTHAGKDQQVVLGLCESASRLYRHNYYFAILAAEGAYYSSFQLQGEAAARSIADAGRWCEAGLALNPYRVQLRRLKTCLLARSSPAEAARYWESYVDWQYWEAENHVLLVELYALTGDYDRAVATLFLIKDSPLQAQARSYLDEALKREKEQLRELKAP